MLILILYSALCGTNASLARAGRAATKTPQMPISTNWQNRTADFRLLCCIAKFTFCGAL
jgi:hypothetical protein